MARTQITAITALARDTVVSQAAVQTAVTTGNYISGGTQDISKIYLQVQWGTTAGTVTVRAPGNGVNVAGAAQTSPYPSSAVFALGAQGDLAYSGGTVGGPAWIGPLSSDRFTQPDGNLYIDWSTASGPVQFNVIQAPWVVV